MKTLTLTKETEPNGKVYYYIILDGRVLHCETDKDVAEKIYQTVRRNAGIKTVEILKSEEV